jgi:hypothetical protein
MNLEERITTFSELGEILRNTLDGKEGRFLNELNNLIERQQVHNQWFTPDNVRMSVSAIAGELNFDNLKKWTDAYPDINQNINPLNVGVIMAGNIPLAGFHDLLSVLITGNNLIAKTSSKDAELIVYLGEIICSINTGFAKKIRFTNNTLAGFDTVIATGSDNSSRYFEYYFGKYPHIIRRNRNSIAVIDGTETDNELEDLGTDIFSYFGLGCRNVSKVYLPEGYDFHIMIKNWTKFSAIAMHSKYANNYEFNMAVYLVNKEKFLDTGFLLLKESYEISSPVSVLYYEYYSSEDGWTDQVNKLQDRIQCITGKKHIPFGRAQFPKLWDYADRIDTFDFLLKKNMAGIL